MIYREIVMKFNEKSVVLELIRVNSLSGQLGLFSFQDCTNSVGRSTEMNFPVTPPPNSEKGAPGAGLD